MARLRACVAALIAAWLSASVARADAPITPPRPTKPLRVAYPEGAAGEHDVLLELTIGADGRVQAARVVEGPAPFTEAALAAAQGFSFEPARRGDRPLRARIRASIHFEPKPAKGAPPPPPAPAPTRPLEVVVRGETHAPGAHALGGAEVRVLPGAFGDPFRAIEALPGVVPMTSGLPYFYVRGAPPGNVGYFLDDVRVPALFHAMLGPAVLPSALVDRVELHPGGYPAQYGRFAGGVLAATTRPPAKELTAQATLRLVDAGAFVEAPFPDGRGAAMAAARYSYTAPVLSLISPSTKLEFWDYQARLSLQISPRDRLTILAFGAHDYAAARTNNVWKPLIASEFHRIDLRYDARLGEHTRVTHALTLGLDRGTGSVFNDAVYDTATPLAHDRSISARSRVTHRASETVTLRAGADAGLDSYTGEVGPVPLPAASLFPSRQDFTGGAFVDAVITAGGGVELVPGLRVDLWSSKGSAAVSFDPRLAVRVPLGDRVRLVDAVGLAHQTPGFAVHVPGLAIAGLQGGLQRSFQTSAGVEVDLPLSIQASATLFYSASFNLSDPFGDNGETPWASEAALAALRERALGSSVGLEVHVRRKLTERLGGFVAYTLSRATRYAQGTSFAARYDRTHVLQAALSWDIGHGVRVGVRGALQTGSPLEPFFPDWQVNMVGAEREPAYFRLDARAEKRWQVGARGYVSLVAEMLNATLAKQPNGIACFSVPYTYGCTVSRFGPLSIPSLGVEAGF